MTFLIVYSQKNKSFNSDSSFESVDLSEEDKANGLNGTNVESTKMVMMRKKFGLFPNARTFY